MDQHTLTRELTRRRSSATPMETRPLSYADVVSGDLGTDSESKGLLEYWDILRRRRKTVVLFTLLGLSAAALFTMLQTPTFRARTAIEIQNVNSDFLNAKQVNPVAEDSAMNLLTDVQTQLKIIDSEALINRVIDTLKSNGEMPSRASKPSLLQTLFKLPAPSAADRDYDLRQSIRKSLSVEQSGATRVIELTFKSTDPHFAATFLNALTSAYIDGNIEARMKMSERTGQWLSNQLGDMRAKLRSSEDALQAYASHSGLLYIAPSSASTEQSDVSEEKLRELQQSLSAAQADRAAAQSRYEVARSASPDSLGDVLNDQPLRDLQAKLTDLRREYAEAVVTYTPKHEKVLRIEAQIGPLQAEFNTERKSLIDHIHNDYEAAARREALLRADYEAQTHVVTDQAQKSVQYSILKREVDSNRQLYESTLQQVREASVTSAIRASNIRVVDPAATPHKPYSPSYPLNGAAGLFGGLMVGLMFAVAGERGNRALQEPGDVGLWTSLPELATIPDEKVDKVRRLSRGASRLLPGQSRSERPGSWTGKNNKRVNNLLAWQEPGLLADAFRGLATSLMFSGDNNILVVTSASRMDGKTTVVSNLGVTMAQTHKTVLIIDGDLRRPRMHDIFDLSNTAGLSTLLSTDSYYPDLANQLVAKTSIPGLNVLTSGPSTPYATGNLVYSPRLPQILATLKKRYDVVLIDTPPMLHMSDARILGKFADGVIVVTRAGRTTRDAAKAVHKRFEEDGTPVIGVILNGWRPDNTRRSDYGSYDDAYYGPETASAQSRKRRPA